ncbi:MAG: hypothetical protein CM15mP18_2890 [Methanobacteriota archaeon]|nr:MAG: hypothetical protein CM15mP18_2890 [Euryarchaeota archaeon]
MKVPKQGPRGPGAFLAPFGLPPLRTLSKRGLSFFPPPVAGTATDEHWGGGGGCRGYIQRAQKKVPLPVAHLLKNMPSKRPRPSKARAPRPPRENDRKGGESVGLGAGQVDVPLGPNWKGEEDLNPGPKMAPENPMMFPLGDVVKGGLPM